MDAFFKQFFRFNKKLIDMYALSGTACATSNYEKEGCKLIGVDAHK